MKAKKEKKKYRGLKRAIVFLSVILVLVVSGYVALLVVEKKDTNEELSAESTEDTKSVEETIKNLTKNHKEISFDEESGVVFVNNEIILQVSLGTPLDEVEELVEDYDGEIVDAREDMGFYQILLEDELAMEELEDLMEEIKEEELVKDVFVNPVLLMEDSAASPDPDADPVYPEDPWGQVDWDMEVPRGNNWNMEAIHAPKAWAYLDELETAKVGLIDSMVKADHEDLTVSGSYVSLYDTEKKKWKTVENAAERYAPATHGTHVAGTMAAVWNDKGVCGVLGNNCELYYSEAYNTKNDKIQDDYHTAYTYVQAIEVLLRQDVQGINISQNTNRAIGFAASHGNEAARNHLEAEASLAGSYLETLIMLRERDKKPDFVICVSAGNINGYQYYSDPKALYGYKEKNGNNGWGKKVLQGGALAKYNNFLALIENESVKDRIIVVGAAGIDKNNSTEKQTRYQYAYFSCLGERVDITAPGVDVFSTYFGDYKYYPLDGTSMAAPHVTAAAAMAFAANPKLTGPEVKRIVCSSVYDRFYHGDGSSGMLDLAQVVQKALETREHSVNRVVGSSQTDGLDLCFVVDTTGSMSDDIANAKENMLDILGDLEEKTPDYRVAVVDYRDFASRSGDEQDYPAEVQLEFSADQEEIVAAINGLDLGNGGDDRETVYAGFARALRLDWRDNAAKAMIVLGDAAPLDPEPETGYTYDSIVEALYNANVAIDVEASDKRVLGEGEDSLIHIYSIGTDASSDAIDFFEEISSATGGAYTGVESASEVATAISDSIEMIELDPVQTVDVDFGQEFSEEIVELYYDEEYQFSIPLDESGRFELDDMPIEEYEWKISRLHREGSIEVEEGEDEASIETEKGTLISLGYTLWYRHKTEIFLYTVCGLLVLILLLTAIYKILTTIDRYHKRKQALVEPQGQFCSNCGAKQAVDAMFCDNCGARL